MLVVVLIIFSIVNNLSVSNNITTSGDIIACLDIERRPEFIQGNILKDRFNIEGNEDIVEEMYQVADACSEEASSSAPSTSTFCGVTK